MLIVHRIESWEEHIKPTKLNVRNVHKHVSSDPAKSKKEMTRWISLQKHSRSCKEHL